VGLYLRDLEDLAGLNRRHLRTGEIAVTGLAAFGPVGDNLVRVSYLSQVTPF
jgi:hypothetical protein